MTDVRLTLQPDTSNSKAVVYQAGGQPVSSTKFAVAGSTCVDTNTAGDLTNDGPFSSCDFTQSLKIYFTLATGLKNERFIGDRPIPKSICLWIKGDTICRGTNWEYVTPGNYKVIVASFNKLASPANPAKVPANLNYSINFQFDSPSGIAKHVVFDPRVKNTGGSGMMYSAIALLVVFAALFLQLRALQRYFSR